MPRDLLITCEHAVCDLPPEVDLGLSDDILESHVSYDRGALEIAERLAELTGAPLHRGRLSRLVVDLNRREDNPDVILEETYGIPVPGNVGIDAAAREARIATWHRPYRHAVRANAERIAASSHCLHLSVHAFDPTLDPEAKSFDVGVLFDPARSPERRIAAQIAEHLRGHGWDTRLNEPYAGTPEGLTSWLRAQIPAARYTGIEIEASRRWIDDPGAIDRFANSLRLAIGEEMTRDAHCHACGEPLDEAEYPKTCLSCGNTVWDNPVPVSVVLVPVRRADREGLLVIRRGIEPGKGKLALVGGFLESHETWQVGGAREVEEETGVVVDPATVECFWFVSTDPKPNRVLLFSTSAPVEDAPPFEVTTETTGRGLVFGPDGLDEELAFPLHAEAARRWFAARGVEGPHDYEPWE